MTKKQGALVDANTLMRSLKVAHDVCHDLHRTLMDAPGIQRKLFDAFVVLDNATEACKIVEQAIKDHEWPPTT